MARSGEVVWNDEHGTSGGGISDYYSLPDYQWRANIPLSVNPPGERQGRGLPDVAGHASGYHITSHGQEAVAGGTSAVAPLWAGFIALINEKLGKPVGFLHPLLYRFASQSMCRDITTGNNGAYKAGRGWDACTGLGSPDGEKLLQYLSSPELK
jgi:kumamolisin